VFLHAIKSYGGQEVQLHAFLTSALHVMCGHRDATTAVHPRKEPTLLPPLFGKSNRS
jgi:hypothetical protein